MTPSITNAKDLSLMLTVTPPIVNTNGRPTGCALGACGPVLVTLARGRKALALDLAERISSLIGAGLVRLHAQPEARKSERLLG
jgi:hypothetical protein